MKSILIYSNNNNYYNKGESLAQLAMSPCGGKAPILQGTGKTSINNK